MSAKKTTLVTLVCFNCLIDTVTVLDGTCGRIKLDIVNQYAIAFMRKIVCYTNLTTHINPCTYMYILYTTM